ncbi:hypothetical protein C8R42DRAFT_705996 [Lentinula raphanica]|nr:hypothetical protein C8R42DRAFT_705996 [Lentinula raphanica]
MVDRLCIVTRTTKRSKYEPKMTKTTWRKSERGKEEVKVMLTKRYRGFDTKRRGREFVGVAGIQKCMEQLAGRVTAASNPLDPSIVVSGPVVLRNKVVAEEIKGEEAEEAWEKVKGRQFHVWMPIRRISASSA